MPTPLITPNVTELVRLTDRVHERLGGDGLALFVSVVNDAWQAFDNAPLRSRSGLVAAMLLSVARQTRDEGNPWFAQQFTLAAETFAVAWRAELEASAVAVPDYVPDDEPPAIL